MQLRLVTIEHQPCLVDADAAWPFDSIACNVDEITAILSAKASTLSYPA
jgi:hypothetical protein